MNTVINRENKTKETEPVVVAEVNHIDLIKEAKEKDLIKPLSEAFTHCKHKKVKSEKHLGNYYNNYYICDLNGDADVNCKCGFYEEEGK